MSEQSRGILSALTLLVLLTAPCYPFPSTAAVENPGAGAPEGVRGGWMSRVQRSIAASEYEITWQGQTLLADLDGAWHAPNRAHNLRTYFTDHAIRVIPRTEAEPSWDWGLSLLGFGRGASVTPVEHADLSLHKNRIEYARGPLIEWYVNDPRGLEQGFTIDAPPEDLPLDGPSWNACVGGRSPRPGSSDERHAFLVLALRGTLAPEFSADGRAIDFVRPGGGKVLRFAKLRVTDLRGRELAARMEGFAEAGVRGLRILFDDSDAAYPVSVDPLLTSPAWSAESDQADAHFGLSVATAGDVSGDGFADVIVGAPNFDNGQGNEGRVFVYHGSDVGLDGTADWVAESDESDALFGFSVSTAGDVNRDGFSDVIIGAHGFIRGLDQVGRAYVWHGGSSGLGSPGEPNWIVEGDQHQSWFGNSVATAGDVDGDGYSDVIVGAWNYDLDADGTKEGAAFVYHGSTSGLSGGPGAVPGDADWTGDGSQDNARFGISVATAGDVNGDGTGDVIVGAEWYSNGPGREGRAFVYYGSTSGLSGGPSAGPDDADWTVESNQFNGFQNVAVATAGDVNGDGYADLIVGAGLYDNPQPDEGRVFVYHGSAAGPSGGPNAGPADADWSAESDQASAVFGWSSITAGDVNGDGYADVVIGSPSYDVNADGTMEGAAFVYYGSSAGLGANGTPGNADWTAEGDQPESGFGACVAPAGDVDGDGYADVIVGASDYDNGESNEGRAYVYRGSPAGLQASPAWTAERLQPQVQFGYSVSTAGDVNGDGFADVIVGAPFDDDLPALPDDEGKAYVYHGSEQGLNASADWIVEGGRPYAYLGISVAQAGDVNGDGFGDVIVGALGYDNGQPAEGRAFVYHGSPTGLSGSPAWTGESDQASAHFGESVSTAGDVNGDGFADIIVGAPDYDNPEPNEGGVFVYYGSDTGLDGSVDWFADGGQPGANFGAAVATAGDVNGDGSGGFSDILISAPGYDATGDGTPDEVVFAYYGSDAGLDGTADWAAWGGQPFSSFGASISTAGDVNGDGFADVILGAPGYSNGEAAEGRALVYHGSDTGLDSTVDWSVESNRAGAFFGVSVSTAGDVNGDGIADVIVGADNYSNGQPGEGRAVAYLGSAGTGLATTPAWSVESNENFANFGNSVSTAGDVNGDGFADVIVGAALYSAEFPRIGRAYVYYGGGGPGASLVPGQWQPTTNVPLSPLGRSTYGYRFDVGLRGLSPFGGGRAKLEWEVKPLGVSFDGSVNAASADWVGLAGGGAVFREAVTGLSDNTPYHWRVRLRYDGASTPYQQFSRWVTVPHNGWNELDLWTSTGGGGTDSDGDGIPNDVDCDDSNNQIWAIPGETGPISIASDKQTISWGPPLAPGGTSPVYDVIRSPVPYDFSSGAGAECAASDIAATSVVDSTNPNADELLFYLIRAENSCGSGDLGPPAVPRSARGCPDDP